MQQALQIFGSFTKTLGFLTKSISFNFGNYVIPFTYWEIAVIVFLIFILILMMAQFRRHYVDWSLKGAVFGIFFGFLLALILEGFLIIGGKTALTEVLGWKNAPAPISMALDAGRKQLIQVLGIETQIPSSSAKENIGIQTIVTSIQSLNPSDLGKVKTLICKP